MSSWRLEAGSPVFANTVYQSAWTTPDIQHLTPFSTQPPSRSGSGVARVAIPITSLPAPDSERPKPDRKVPSAIPGRYFCFCSSDPAISSGPVGRRVSSNMSEHVLEYFATSSTATVSPRMPAPEPPYSGGMHSPRSPASRNASNTSCGYSPVSSISRDRGRTLSRASRRTDDLSSVSSSERSKSTLRGYSEPQQRSSGRLGSGALAALAHNPTPLALGEPAPHALTLA